MQKATEKTKTNLLNVQKFFLLSAYFAEKKFFIKLTIKNGEKAKTAPDKKATQFFNTDATSFSWSNLWFK